MYDGAINCTVLRSPRTQVTNPNEAERGRKEKGRKRKKQMKVKREEERREER